MWTVFNTKTFKHVLGLDKYFHGPSHGIAQHSAARHGMTPHGVAQNITAQHGIALHGTA